MLRTAPWLALLLLPSAALAQSSPLIPSPFPTTTAAEDDQLLFRGDPFDRPPQPGAPPRGSSLHVAAGVDALFLAPRFQSNPAYYVQTFAPTGFGPTASTRRIDEFSYDVSASPRLWLAFADAETGFGFRTRWFLFDQSAKGKEITNPGLAAGGAQTASLVTSVSPMLSIGTPVTAPAVNSVRIPGAATDDRLAFGSRLRLQQWDFDATLGDLVYGPWTVTAFGGARYAHLSQGYSAFLAGAVPQSLEFGQSFVGWGPTAGVEFRRGFAGTGLAAFGSMRYSALLGTTNASEFGANIGLIPTGGGLTLHDDATTRRAVLSVVDLELGGEWVRPLGRGELMFRPAVVAFLYNGGSGTSVFGDFGLIGVSVTTGLRF
jgi:hypothetical protein